MPQVLLQHLMDTVGVCWGRKVPRKVMGWVMGPCASLSPGCVPLLEAHPLWSPHQEKEQGEQSEPGSHKQWGCAALHQQRI